MVSWLCYLGCLTEAIRMTGGCLVATRASVPAAWRSRLAVPSPAEPAGRNSHASQATPWLDHACCSRTQPGPCCGCAANSAARAADVSAAGNPNTTSAGAQKRSMGFAQHVMCAAQTLMAVSQHSPRVQGESTWLPGQIPQQEAKKDR